MKQLTTWLLVGILLGCGAVVQGGTNRYVSATGTNDAAGGYTNWAGAATNIQLAVDVAGAGDIIYITNGTYTLTNQVNLGTKAITLEGFNGSSNTFINGNYPLTTNRCFYLNNASAIISGLTISNGYAAGLDEGGTNGGGIYLYAGLIRSCVISSNMAGYRGGGVYMTNGVITNSTITRNYAATGGGGVSCYGDTKVQNCAITLNYSGNGGGGVEEIYNVGGPTAVENCMISNNSSVNNGGGLLCQHNSSTLKNCVIVQNTTGSGGGGVRVDVGGTQIQGCLFMNNKCTRTDGSGQGGAIWSWADFRMNITNCTIVSNSATSQGGGIYLHPNNSVVQVVNTIIYSNTAASGANYYDSTSKIYFTNSCTTPLPTLGTDNTADYPQFADWANNNYRLTANSPCLNTGLNQSWMTGAVDLDGHRRIDRLFGRVDMGAYEFIHKITMFSVH